MLVSSYTCSFRCSDSQFLERVAWIHKGNRTTGRRRERFDCEIGGFPGSDTQNATGGQYVQKI